MCLDYLYINILLRQKENFDGRLRLSSVFEGTCTHVVIITLIVSEQKLQEICVFYCRQCCSSPAHCLSLTIALWWRVSSDSFYPNGKSRKLSAQWHSKAIFTALSCGSNKLLTVVVYHILSLHPSLYYRASCDS